MHPEPFHPEPFYVQPDPDRPFYVQPKPERLVRRGPCEYLIVWKKPDGRPVETPLGAASFRMEGI